MGARNLRECLLLQLAEIKARGTPPLVPFVEEIITHYLAELGEHKFTVIAHTLGTSYERVVHGARFYQDASSAPTRRRRGPARPEPALAGALCGPRRDHPGAGRRFEVEVVESLRFSLQVNPLYHRLSAAAALHPQGRVPRLTATATAMATADEAHDRPPRLLTEHRAVTAHHSHGPVRPGQRPHPPLCQPLQAVHLQHCPAPRDDPAHHHLPGDDPGRLFAPRHPPACAR